ncbi:hypothetical protein [Vibrio furnissii]|uniref:hypothetical protein n=1 Tax=Vibrio furnissii TaxID=29494 RepID=UPI001EEA273C|nr:hypothetical protein [Vibrio furnissii]MCG6268303.1 hypothetical protein [Vibrio furnissii]
MAIDRTAIKAMITACYNAELEVLAGKTVQFGGRAVTMESLGEIRKARQEYERKLQSINTRGRRRPKTVRFS